MSDASATTLSIVRENILRVGIKYSGFIHWWASRFNASCTMGCHFNDSYTGGNYEFMLRA